MKFFAVRATALAGALRLIGRSPGVFALSVLLGGLALALPAAVGLLAWQVAPLVQRVPLAPQATVFAKVSVTRTEVAALQQSIAQRPAVAAVRLLPRETALAELLQRAGTDAALSVNPLPDSLIVGFAPGTPPALVEQTLADLRRLPQVESVQGDTGWYRKLAALLDAAQRIGALVASAGLLLAALTLIGALRLLTVASATEIRTLRLVGADERFIRRPLFYAAVLTLLTAAVIAVALVWAASAAVLPAWVEVARLYELPPSGAAVATSLHARTALAVAAVIVLIGGFLAAMAARAGLRAVG
ncbi:MAG: cell division protein FtsX [Betaproteobacteria bacterium]